MRLSPGGRSAFTLIEILIVVAIIGMVTAIAIPNFIKTRKVASTQVCLENLAQIESAKQIWGVENGKPPTAAVTAADIVGPTLYIKRAPLCPAGGTYDYRTISISATCSEPGHSL